MRIPSLKINNIVVVAAVAVVVMMMMMMMMVPLSKRRACPVVFMRTTFEAVSGTGCNGLLASWIPTGVWGPSERVNDSILRAHSHYEASYKCVLLLFSSRRVEGGERGVLGEEAGGGRRSAFITS